MTQEKVIPISDELKAFIGKEINRRTSPPVSLSDIRKWAIAIYWPETPPRLFWDEEYARKTRYGGIIAPEDFNPFAWPVDRTTYNMGDEPTHGPTKRMGIGLGMLNGGGGNEFVSPLRPGDIITSVTKFDDIFCRQGSKWPMLFFVRKTTWTNQRGDVIKYNSHVAIKH